MRKEIQEDGMLRRLMRGEHVCDRCGMDVTNGDGYYPDDGTGDRICEGCEDIHQAEQVALKGK